jgi:S-adenosylmethionine hydrolase
MPVVSLLTDFGTRDGYVGAMKGVLLARDPGLTLVDVSHEIPPGDIAAASYVLGQAARWFAVESVHLVVVDPGVGSARRALALRCEGRFYVGPDNGVFSCVFASRARIDVHEISAPRFAPADASPVFHGRDVFAPAAAHLAGGGLLRELGPAVDPGSLVQRPWPAPELGGPRWRGEVVHIDRFGNLITNVPAPAEPLALLPAHGRVWAGKREIHFGRTYSDVPAGELIALFGSAGLLEIALNGGSAAASLRLDRGAVVEFAPLG